MKHLPLILFSLLLISCAEHKTSEPVTVEDDVTTTTYYLIRHAEKDRTNPDDEDPNLNEEGVKRAQNWATIFSELDIDVIYSSDFKRTMQTAKPIADSKNLPVNHYDPHGVYHTDFFEITSGLNVLVVGHSNTIPVFANHLLQEARYELIPDSIDGRLYVVTRIGNNTNSFILNLE
jgi:2,3-bisphosphoglycerate-dependent phosphoglycerate mutase